MQDFIFSEGIWLGEGKITLSTSPEVLQFYMKWEILPQISGIIKARQTIQILGVQENTINNFAFSNIAKDNFEVMIENQVFGQVLGKGTIKEKIVAWKFQGDPTFEGFETYKQFETGEFFLQAEYGKDQYRTIIEGVIWRKSS